MMSTQKRGKTLKQATIGGMFSKRQQNDAKLASPSRRLFCRHDLGSRLTDNHVQALKFAGDHHNEQASKKRQRLEKKSLKSPNDKRPRLDDDDDDDNDELPDVPLAGAFGDDGWGDESGYRWLTQLQQYVTKTTRPNPAEYQQLVTILRMHGLHSDKSLSLQAFGLLQMIQAMFPAVKLASRNADGEDGLCVSIDDAAFNFLDRKFRQSAHPYDCQQVDTTNHLPFHVFCHMVSALHNMCLGIDDQPTYEVRHNDVGALFGEVLLLKCLVSELHRDLQIRLKVLEGSQVMKGETMDKWRTDLLKETMLWRLFSEELGCDTYPEGRMEVLVGMLMEIIGAAGSGQEQPFGCTQEEADLNWLEMSGVTPSDGAAIATLLLNMLLEMYGVAEDLGVFCATSKARAASTNMRMKMDIWMHDGISKHKGQDCFKMGDPLPACRAFLSALAPRDCQRFIGLLIASKRVHKDMVTESDKALTMAKRLYLAPKDAKRYVTVDPVHVLTYVAATHVHALAYLDIGGADGLALLVTQLVKAVLDQQPTKATLDELRPRMEDIAGKLIHDDLNKTGGKFGLHPTSVVALAAACHALEE